MLSVYPLWESRSEAPCPFLLEEAILGACLAGRCGPPAAVAHPPVTATAQKDDHFLLEAGLPFPLSLPSSPHVHSVSAPSGLDAVKSAAPHKRSGAQAVKSRGRHGPENCRPSLPSLAPFDPTKPGLLREALQRQGVSYQLLQSGSGLLPTEGLPQRQRPLYPLRSCPRYPHSQACDPGPHRTPPAPAPHTWQAPAGGRRGATCHYGTPRRQ